jgi:hypothetical protein
MRCMAVVLGGCAHRHFGQLAEIDLIEHLAPWRLTGPKDANILLRKAGDWGRILHGCGGSGCVRMRRDPRLCRVVRRVGARQSIPLIETDAPLSTVHGRGNDGQRRDLVA